MGDDFDVTEKDAIWFAFISTSTVGLGDYYLQPEVMFGSDAMKFSVWFLTGFVFLSNFFGKVAESLASILPKRNNSLEARLENTRVFACWKRGALLRLIGRHPSDENEEETDEAKTTEPEVLLQRVQSLQSFLTEEQQEELEDGDAKAVDTEPRAGENDAAFALRLIEEEEALLQDLISLVHEKHERLLAQTQKNSDPEDGEGEKSDLEGSSSDRGRKATDPSLTGESSQFYSCQDVFASDAMDDSSNRSINTHNIDDTVAPNADNDSNHHQVNNGVDELVSAMSFSNGGATSGQESELEKCQIM